MTEPHPLGAGSRLTGDHPAGDDGPLRFGEHPQKLEHHPACRGRGYDNLSRLTSTSSSQGYSHSFTYDALNRKTGEATPFGTVASQYDAAGDRTRLTWPDGFYVTYAYDLLGEMTTVRENGATTLASIAYEVFQRANKHTSYISGRWI